MISNIWSKNKYVEILIDVLIFLMSINFLHYGQLILPIICLILFVDRKFKFYVKNLKIFIVLCLFGISFLAFSYNLGFYCVMGLCFPMAYYIGSNMNEISEENIKKVIYIIVIGMVAHYFLNFAYEISRFGWEKTLTKSTRYDFWLRDEFVSTGTATNAVIILSIFYFLLIRENNKSYKTIGLILFVATLIYTFVLRRKIQLGILGISFVISMLIDIFYYKDSKNKKKIFTIMLISIIAFIGIIYICYVYDLFTLRSYLKWSSIFIFTKNEGLNSGRLEILLSGLRFVPTYIFGGKNISSLVGMPFHDLLLNIYDYAGIIPTILMIIYLILVAINIVRVIKSNTISNDFKLLFIEIVIGYTIMFFLEPLMTGSSLFLIVGILIEACVELLI